jgi:hypothetical protein
VKHRDPVMVGVRRIHRAHVIGIQEASPQLCVKDPISKRYTLHSQCTILTTPAAPGPCGAA